MGPFLYFEAHCLLQISADGSEVIDQLTEVLKLEPFKLISISLLFLPTAVIIHASIIMLCLNLCDKRAEGSSFR